MQVPRITLASEAKLIAHIDGEPYELPRTAFTVSVVPKALRVLVPA